MSERIVVSEHTHTEQAFPPAVENLLLGLADRARAGTLPSQSQPLEVDKLAAIEEKYGLSEVRDRLGEAYPRLPFDQEAAVIAAFDRYYEELPVSHARYAHAHSHEHHHVCNKTHGPVRRTLESVEQAVTGRIRNERLKMLAATAFRASSLVVCPGDDIAAMGLQMYSVFAGHSDTHSHRHEEPKAILPRRSRIDFATNTAIITIPLDTLVQHADLPSTPEGRLIQEHIDDIALPKPERKKEIGERLRRKMRVALLGFIALTAMSSLASDEKASQDAQPARAALPAALAPQVVTDSPQTELPRQPKRTEVVKVTQGDSRWYIAEKQVHQAIGERGSNALVNGVTLLGVYADRHSSQDPHIVHPGQNITVPNASAIRALRQAVMSAKTNPHVAADMQIINRQTRYGSKAAAAASARIYTHLHNMQG